MYIESKLPKIKNDLKHYINYFLKLGVVIIIGQILKMIYPLSQKSVGKTSILTGIYFLRAYYLVAPIIMMIVTLTQILFIKNNFYNEILFQRFIKKMNFGFLMTNISLITIFYLLYYTLYIPYAEYSEFKISGHVLAASITGSAILNVRYLSQQLYNHKLYRSMMKIISHICTFLLIHNIYTTIWTVWIYHNLREVVVSYFISITYIFIIYLLDIDRLIINLLYPQILHKEKNLIK